MGGFFNSDRLEWRTYTLDAPAAHYRRAPIFYHLVKFLGKKSTLESEQMPDILLFCPSNEMQYCYIGRYSHYAIAKKWRLK